MKETPGRLNRLIVDDHGKIDGIYGLSFRDLADTIAIIEEDGTFGT